MLMSKWSIKIRILLALINLSACNNSTFRGSSQGKPADQPTPTQTPAPKIACKDQTTRKPVDVLFVIDNSASNSKTDCASPTSLGNGREQCQGASNRAGAVLSSFDLLASQPATDQSVMSRVGVVSFPSAGNIYSGADLQTKNWLNVATSNRAALERSLGFTRYPAGMTPYGAGLAEASTLISKDGSAERARVVIFVSDGEPTDQDPDSARNYAAELKHSYHTEIITVLVSNDRASRLKQHEAYLRSNGYSESTISALIGENGNGGLVQTISDKVLEVSDSAALKKELQALVQERTACQ